MAQRVKVLAAKVDALSLIPKIYMAEEERDLTPTSCPLTSDSALWCIHTYIHDFPTMKNTIRKLKNKRQNKGKIFIHYH